MDGPKTPGEINYEGYGKNRNWKTFYGKPIPSWNNLGQDIRDGWEAGALDVLNSSAEASGPLTDQEADTIYEMMRPMYNYHNSLARDRDGAISEKAITSLMRMRDRGLIAISGDKLLPTQAGIKAFFDRFPEKEMRS